ncbi:hypothetical protein HD806DRAFT_530756 [Xylariaceae sp. AK1471]|nr:hypothetical protein HD806DRAFT_530756 [Xylariaceae sp. AK1471]
MASITSSQAFEAAIQRAQPGRLSRLGKLPTELKLVVAGKISDLQSLISLALSGPEFYAFVTSYEGELAAKVVTAILGADLMPLADAGYIAMALKKQMTVGCEEPDRLGNDFSSLLDPVMDRQLDSSTRKRVHPQITNIHIAGKYIDTYNAIYQYAESEVKDWRLPLCQTLTSALSSREIQRFIKALYILVVVAWATSIHRLPHPEEAATRYHTVLARFKPWAEQQAECMLDMLVEYWDDILSIYINSPGGRLIRSPDSLIAEFVLCECIEGLNDFRDPESIRATEDFIMTYIEKKRPMTAEELLVPFPPW